MVFVGPHGSNFSNVLHIIVVGKNPLNMDAIKKESESSQDKTVEKCVKALMDELLFSIFRFAKKVVTPFKDICLVLDLLPDVAIGGLVMDIKFRRSSTFQTVLLECLGMYLAACHELLEFFLYLRSCPNQAAALIAPDADSEMKGRILNEMRAEWQMVVRLESSQVTASDLHDNCRYVCFQSYRELMSVWEKHQWKLHPEALSLTLAWMPEVAWSSNIESLFKEMTSAVRRSGSADVGSLPNLMAVAIRGLHRRLCVGDSTPEPLKLSKEDWAGAQIPALKAKIFSPTSAPTCRSNAR
ncbi:unnamed protein product, partial [Symbiodinium necroappetens]